MCALFRSLRPPSFLTAPPLIIAKTPTLHPYTQTRHFFRHLRLSFAAAPHHRLLRTPLASHHSRARYMYAAPPSASNVSAAAPLFAPLSFLRLTGSSGLPVSLFARQSLCRRRLFFFSFRSVVFIFSSSLLLSWNPREEEDKKPKTTKHNNGKTALLRLLGLCVGTMTVRELRGWCVFPV